MKRRKIFDVSRDQRYKSKVINGNPDELGTVLLTEYGEIYLPSVFEWKQTLQALSAVPL